MRLQNMHIYSLANLKIKDYYGLCTYYIILSQVLVSHANSWGWTIEQGTSKTKDQGSTQGINASNQHDSEKNEIGRRMHLNILLYFLHVGIWFTFVQNFACQNLV